MNISIYQLSLVSSLSLLRVLVLWKTRTLKTIRTEMYLCGLQTCLQLPVSRNVRGKGLWLPPPFKNLCAVHLMKTNIKLQFIILLQFPHAEVSKNIFHSNCFRKTRSDDFFFNLFVFGPRLFVALGDLWTLSAFVHQHQEQRSVADGKKQNKTQLCPKFKKKNHFVPPTMKFQNTSFSNNSYKLLTEMSTY